MTQVFFGASTAPLETDLDANFADLYPIALATTVVSGKVGFGITPGGGYQVEIGGALNIAPTNTVGPQIVARFYDAGGGAGEGSILQFESANRPDAARIWEVGETTGASLVISTNSANTGTASERLRIDPNGNGLTGTDNAQTWGSSAKRWSVIYAGTGAINTSDAREKTALVPMSAAELSAAKQIGTAIGTYKWLAAIQAKSGDARTHVGITVQAVIAIMTANGLDPMAYGFVCYDAWPEVKDAAGNVTQAAGDRYGLRPDELLLFLARGFDARLTLAGF